MNTCKCGIEVQDCEYHRSSCGNPDCIPGRCLRTREGYIRECRENIELTGCEWELAHPLVEAVWQAKEDAARGLPAHSVEWAHATSPALYDANGALTELLTWRRDT